MGGGGAVSELKDGPFTPLILLGKVSVESLFSP